MQTYVYRLALYLTSRPVKTNAHGGSSSTISDGSDMELVTSATVEPKACKGNIQATDAVCLTCCDTMFQA